MICISYLNVFDNNLNTFKNHGFGCKFANIHVEMSVTLKKREKS